MPAPPALAKTACALAHDIRIQPKGHALSRVRDLATRRNHWWGTSERGATPSPAVLAQAWRRNRLPEAGDRGGAGTAEGYRHGASVGSGADVPGVGETPSATRRMPELGRNRAAVGMLAGLAPHARDSGKREGKRFCWGGRANVRRALYMPMLSAVQRYGLPAAGPGQRVSAEMQRNATKCNCARRPPGTHKLKVSPLPATPDETSERGAP